MHYNGENSYLFLNNAEIHKLKAKIYEIHAIASWIGNISKDSSAENMKKIGFHGHFYSFCADYVATVVDDI